MITDPHQAHDKPHKYLDLLGMVWISFLILASFTAPKTFMVGPFALSVALIAYPIIYIFADIFTEVYGYTKTRRIVWTGLACLLIVSLMGSLYALVPPDVSYKDDASFRTVFLGTPAIVVAEIFAFFSGEFSNSFVIAKMKVLFQGRFLHARLIGSTLAGQMADNLIFYTLAHVLGGFYDLTALPNLVVSTVAFCTLWEAIALPVTSRVVQYLKRAEGMDIYDRATDFNPFAVHLFSK